MTEMVKLGDVGSFVSGGTPSRKHPEYFEGTIPWVSTPVLNGGLIDESNAVQLITEEAIANSATKLLPSRSLLIGIRVGIGKTAVNTVPMCTNQDIVAITDVDEMHWDIRYLSYAIQAKSAYLVSQKQGATITGITSKLLKSLEVKRFDTETQRRRVSNLDSIRSRIDDCESQLVKLEELVKSRFVEMFEPLFEHDVDDAYKLCDLAEIVSGITKGRKVAAGTPLREVPYMAVSNVKDGYIDWTRVKTIDATEGEIERYRLKPCDVLMTEGGDPDKLGRGALLHEPPNDCIHQNHVFRVRVQDERLRPEYFEYYLQSSKAKDYFFSCAKRTTGIATINKKQISSLPVIVPSIERQDAFISFVQQVDKLKFDDLLTIRKFGCICCKYV